MACIIEFVVPIFYIFSLPNFRLRIYIFTALFEIVQDKNRKLIDADIKNINII